ncbi:hypothetical protein C2869_06240 [Saccharobesus litoralis]|uniref:Uncharacterized protein n=1 Tax=Saccharobesus litoralis TaxID=2172099 RepID=A0A2S0VPE8_9ALTE|nr:hypothetical protein [Saccharobesus litoralis]AWB66062.1 hypothetical protein C2869_06240 [Saccharobesus litoralis]
MYKLTISLLAGVGLGYGVAVLTQGTGMTELSNPNAPQLDVKPVNLDNVKRGLSSTHSPTDPQSKSPAVFQDESEAKGNQHSLDIAASWQEQVALIQANTDLSAVDSRIEILKLLSGLQKESVSAQQDFLLANLHPNSDASLREASFLLLKDFAKRHPSSAVDLLNIMTDEQLADSGAAIMHTLTQNSVDVAYEWLVNADLDRVKQVDSSKFGHTLRRILSVAAQDPNIGKQAYQFAKQSDLWLKANQKYALRDIASSLAQQEPYSLLDQAMAAGNDNGQYDMILVSGALTEIAKQDVLWTTDFLIDNPKINNKDIKRDLIRSLTQADNPEQLKQFYQAMPSQDKANIAAYAAQGYARTDMEQSVDWLKKIDNPKKLTSSLTSMLVTAKYSQDISLNDQVNIVEQLLNQHPQNKASAYKRLYASLSRSDKAQANALIELVPDDETNTRQQLQDFANRRKR